MIQMTTTLTVGDRVAQARQAVGISQRTLSQRTGISQATLSRIESGERAPKMNEVISLAWALGSSVAELTGHSAVRDRVECVARASDNAASMEAMRRELIRYLELDAYLEDQGIAQPA
jgi:transcriptional regulator with XRE-family HTH domain